jgi:Ca-activated chloride channel family protein
MCPSLAILCLSTLDVPLALALMADVSASQRSFNEGHRRDIKEFLTDVLTTRDQAFLACFGSRIQLVGDFTASGKSLMAEFERFEYGGGHYPLSAGTALFDAVYYAVTAKLAAVEGGRRALILFSDGQNNSSTHNLPDTIEAAQIADRRIFTSGTTGRAATPRTRRGCRRVASRETSTA